VDAQAVIRCEERLRGTVLGTARATAGPRANTALGRIPARHDDYDGERAPTSQDAILILSALPQEGDAAPAMRPHPNDRANSTSRSEAQGGFIKKIISPTRN
jgi:hypothetical protein